MVNYCYFRYTTRKYYKIKKLSNNISDKGSWRTDNVRIKIQDDNNCEDILYLIRQSFDNEKNSIA